MFARQMMIFEARRRPLLRAGLPHDASSEANGNSKGPVLRCLKQKYQNSIAEDHLQIDNGGAKADLKNVSLNSLMLRSSGHIVGSADEFEINLSLLCTSRTLEISFFFSLGKLHRKY